jgi:hypothetical protein
MIGNTSNLHHESKSEVYQTGTNNREQASEGEQWETKTEGSIMESQLGHTQALGFSSETDREQVERSV